MITIAEKVPGFDAPTSVELGKPALQQLVGWTGIAGPKGLPDEVADQWGTWMAVATGDAEFQQKISDRGSVIRLMSPRGSNEFIEGQYRVFRTLVDELGMRIEG